MEIIGTAIAMVRGDSESVTVRCFEADGTARPFAPGDKVYFTAKVSYLDELPELQKIVTDFADGAAVISLSPADTKHMRVGEYRYDIQLTTADGAVKTIVPSSAFELKEEITRE